MITTLIDLARGNAHLLAGLVVAAALSFGIGTTAWLGLSVVGDLFSTVSRWGRGPWARLQQLQPALQAYRDNEGANGSSSVSFVLVGAGLVLGLVARDPILSPWMLVLFSALAWWWRTYARRQRRRSKVMPQVLRLLQLLNNYMRDSITGALVKAADRMEEGPVQKAVENATQAHFRGTSWTEAIREHLSGNPMLTRLMLLLAVAPQMEGAEVREAVQAQIKMISVQESLQAEAGAELVLLKFTVYFLAIANATAITAVLFLPAWRGFFTSTLGRRGTFIVASLMASAAYVYFSEEIEVLKEGL